MPRPKRPTLDVSILLEMAGHATMGIALGLAFSFALILFDTSGVKVLIAHSADPKSAMIILASTFTFAFSVGASLTGFVLTMMQRDGRSPDE